jgi:hypothetical protein
MKKMSLVALIACVSFAVMSFKAPTYSEKALSADKVKINLGESNKISLGGNESLIPPTVVVVVALAETSAAAVVVATAAAVSWLFSCKTDLAPIAGQYKSILNEIDLRKLDSRG